MTTIGRRSFISSVVRRAKSVGWVVGHSDKATCHGILAEAVPVDGTIVYSDEYRSYHRIEPQHATVNHG
jgi:hypothetical protein